MIKRMIKRMIKKLYNNKILYNKINILQEKSKKIHKLQNNNLHKQKMKNNKK